MIGTASAQVDGEEREWKRKKREVEEEETWGFDKKMRPIDIDNGDSS